MPSLSLQVVKAHHNICKSLHMPAQSGSTRVLQSMRRGYSREAYLALVDRIRAIIPEASAKTKLADVKGRPTCTIWSCCKLPCP